MVKNSIIVETAPIGKWMRGKNIEGIKGWVKKKGGHLIKVF